MHFDPEYAAAVRSDASLPELGERERELLRSVDPRALTTDELRRARAVHAIVDEYPVSAAVIGLDAVDRFFSSPTFRACVFERGSMALAFGGHYLVDAHPRARGVGAIETAMALARRRVQVPVREAGITMGRAPGIEPVVTAAGMLAFHQRVLARLGSEPLRTLAKRRKPWAERPPDRGREHLLVEAKADGSLAIGTASEGLVELLRAASPARRRAELTRLAVELGADADEAESLLDDLVGDGLLKIHSTT
jgi:hypothetical protein